MRWAATRILHPPASLQRRLAQRRAGVQVRGNTGLHPPLTCVRGPIRCRYMSSCPWSAIDSFFLPCGTKNGLPQGLGRRWWRWAGVNSPSEDRRLRPDPRLEPSSPSPCADARSARASAASRARAPRGLRRAACSRPLLGPRGCGPRPSSARAAPRAVISGRRACGEKRRNAGEGSRRVQGQGLVAQTGSFPRRAACCCWPSRLPQSTQAKGRAGSKYAVLDRGKCCAHHVLVSTKKHLTFFFLMMVSQRSKKAPTRDARRAAKPRPPLRRPPRADRAQRLESSRMHHPAAASRRRLTPRRLTAPWPPPAPAAAGCPRSPSHTARSCGRC